ncbi:Wadjet anti-phage system protein JetD domain-containing protein [Variovorax paradoxus]|uniref:Wadjet anti-phage system protein JetD domain-containing protein n=1 Tax=Variovorax paradoxus TaxID=34073 RepID=UPI003D65DCD2
MEITLVPQALLIRLAHALLERAETSQGKRSATLKLDAKVLPEIHGSATLEAVERIELQLSNMAATGWVNLKLAKLRPFQTFSDRNPTLELCDFEALAAWSGFVPRSEAWNRKFLQHLKQSDSLTGNGKAVLLDYLARSPLTALSGMELEHAESCIVALQTFCQGSEALYLREASARAFHGRSKVLDNREELLRLLGARPDQFLESPVQLLVALPQEQFQRVLFVENLVTFERMCDHRRTAWASAALVFASGFKGAAKRLRRPVGSRLYWRDGSQGAAEQFKSWLYGSVSLSTAFFGDLDYSGMHILAGLRAAFPDCIAWEPGYSALLEMVAAGRGHSPEQADKTGQADPGTTGCRYSDEMLLPAIRRSGLFVDQEASAWDNYLS